MKLSVVTTLYNTAPWLEGFYARTCASISFYTEDFEIILVNDGSPDDSLRVAVDLSRRDSRVGVIDLSRNFGHHKAIMTGLEMASGELIFLIDSDLEEPPESFTDFYAAMQTHRCDVVYGFQDRRKRGLLDRICGAIYYRAVNLLSTVKIPRNLVTARLMTRRFVTNLLRHREREIFISGLWAATGYEQIGIPVAKSSNAVSSYTFWHRLSVGWMSMISFSDRPLVFAAFAGASISCISFLVIVYLVIRRLFQHLAAGWASVVASIWFLGGLTIFLVGLVGLYVSKIFIEVKQRPYTIVRDIYRNGEAVDLDDGAR